MNRDIKNDRMWTAAKEHLKQFNTVEDKVRAGIRLTDTDLTLVKYALLLTSAELQRRRCDDLEENLRIKNLGIDNPPAA